MKQRFQSAFANLIDRGFDAVFRKELTNESVLTSPSDVTVTEEDLLHLDEALERATQKRRTYPATLTQFLDKTMQHQADAAKHIR